MRYDPINANLFINNRKRFCKQLKPGAIAVLNSNDLMPKSADQTFTFKQNADLFYLTGIDQENTSLVLFPDAPTKGYKEVLFIRATDEHTAVWEGKKLSKKEAQKISGIENVFWYDDFKKTLHTIMNFTEHCYLNLNEHDRFSSDVPYHDLRFANKLKKKFPLHTYHKAAPILADLRSIKSKEEIELLKQSCAITNKAFRRVLQFTKPGVTEYEIEAEVTHEFLRNKASEHAYLPIVASGKNSCVLHYIDNNNKCKDGDILLLDFGASYANYAADLSRTIPVNGKFTKRQKDVYNAVLRVMKKATKMLKPGVMLDNYNKKVGKIMEAELIKLGLLKTNDIKKQDPKNPAYKKYFMHGTSHFLGLDVHDVGNRYKPIKEGMVFTCEPGIYIPEESLGIRLENDILVTKNGQTDLMKDIPIEAEEIEALMN